MHEFALSTDEARKKETRRRQSAKLACHDNPKARAIPRDGRSAGSWAGWAVAIKQFALDDDQCNRLLIRERA